MTYPRLLTVIMLATLVSAVSCRKSVERDYHVRIIVPDDYRGLFRMVFSEERGVEIPLEGGDRIFRIPQDGLLRVKGDNPFLKFGTESAEYASGTKIQSAEELFANDITPDSGAVLYRIINGTSDGNESWHVIGTEKEQEQAVIARNNYESQIIKNEALSK